MKSKLSLVLIGTLCILSSCSDTPDVELAREALFSKISRQSHAVVHLKDFQKVNGAEKEFLGQKVYTMEYKATIKFMEDCWMYYDPTGYGEVFETFRTYDHEPEFIPGFTKRIARFEEGDTLSFNGKVSYVETENGWELN